MTIGSRLKDERARLRMSQTDFASAAGVSKNTQINYEKDERSPDAAYLVAVAAVGVDVNFVLFGKPMPVADESLNQAEAEVLGYYRGMSDYNKESVRRMAFAMAAADGALDSGKA